MWAMVLFPVFLRVVQWNIIHQWIRRCSSMCVSPPNSQWEFRSTLLQRTNFLNCISIVFISASYQNSSMKPSKSAVTYIGLSLYLDNSIQLLKYISICFIYVHLISPAKLKTSPRQEPSLVSRFYTGIWHNCLENACGFDKDVFHI